MSNYVEMTRPPARQNLRFAWASQILHRRELVAPEFVGTLRATASKPRRPSSIVLGPMHVRAQGKLQPKLTPTISSFSRQVLGIEGE